MVGELGTGHNAIRRVMPSPIASQIPIVCKALKCFYCPVTLNVTFQCKGTGKRSEKHHHCHKDAE